MNFGLLTLFDYYPEDCSAQEYYRFLLDEIVYVGTAQCEYHEQCQHPPLHHHSILLTSSGRAFFFQTLHDIVIKE